MKRLDPVYPECATLIRYCPLGEVAYVDDGGPMQTFPTLDTCWGRMVPVSSTLQWDAGLKIKQQKDTTQ